MTTDTDRPQPDRPASVARITVGVPAAARAAAIAAYWCRGPGRTHARHVRQSFRYTRWAMRS